MGSVESYKYPEHNIDKAVEITELIHNKGISKPELLAEKLGHSSVEGGAFRNKLTALRRYGLISGRGDIELTSLAKKIVSPKPNSREREEAIAKAVLNVELLEKLYDKLDYKPPDDDFWFQVVEVTNAERSEAKNKASDIRELYEAGLRYVEQFNGQSDQSESGEKSVGKQSNVGSPAKDDVPEEAEAVLITPDARIDIRSRATYIAAKALFSDIGSKYEPSDSGDSSSENSQETGIEDFL